MTTDYDQQQQLGVQPKITITTLKAYTDYTITIYSIVEIGGGALQSQGATSSIMTDEAGTKFLICLGYIHLRTITFIS